MSAIIGIALVFIAVIGGFLLEDGKPLVLAQPKGPIEIPVKDTAPDAARASYVN